MAIIKRKATLFWLVPWLLVTAVWMSSCSQTKDLKDVKDPFYEQWRVKAEESKGHSAVDPPPVDEPPFEIAGKEPAEELEPEIQRSLPTRKISLKMNSIDVSVLLRALAKAATIERRVTRVTLRDTRSRWGSCSSEGRLNFSWRLILTPEPVLDYVVAHEVAHLVHMNHGARFWKLVARLTPPHLRGLGYGLYFFLAFGAGSLGAGLSGWVSDTAALVSVSIGGESHPANVGPDGNWRIQAGS